MAMMKRLASFLVLAVLGLSGAGCAAVAVGAAAGAGVAYVNGNSEGLIQASPERILASAEAVFGEMEIKKQGEVDHDKEDREWKLEGKTPKGSPVKVTVRQIGDDVCKMWVRVGRLGDENYSTTVFDRIEARL